jgi:hypothetical protein
MNPISATPPRGENPRLVCRAVRQWCAIFTEHRPAHASSCPECEAYFQAADSLERTLRRDAIVANGHGLVATPALEQNILRAIRTSDSNVPRARPGISKAAWIGGAISAAAAAAVIAIWPGAEPGSNSRPRIASASSAEDAAAIISTVEALSTELVASVLPTAGAIVAENPLQRELGSVYSDMRSALDFLALNFLPTSQAEQLEERGRRI